MGKFTFKGLMWGPTLRVNLLRSIAAGIVWTILLYVVGMKTPPEMPGPWVYLLFVPVGYLIFFLPIGIIAGWLSKIGVPIVGLITFMPTILILPGDPLVFFLHKYNKNLVPVEKYNFLEFSLCIWVYENMVPQAENVQKSSEPGVKELPCPFSGRILIDEDTGVLGFNWPSQSIAFFINDDWSIATESDQKFGWINTKGEIHKGIPTSGINPQAALAGGNTGLKLHGDSLWAKDEKIGELVR